MGYYGSKKQNEVLIHDRAWMNTQNIMVDERSQTQKGTDCIPSHQISRINKSDRMQINVGQGQGRNSLMDTCFLLGYENILEFDRSDSYITL